MTADHDHDLDLDREPGTVPAFVPKGPLLRGEEVPVASSCVGPMHPGVTAAEPSTCPQCAGTLLPSDAAPAAAHEAGERHAHGGAGRFLVLSRDSAPEPNLVWTDSLLLRAGPTVDVLLGVSNPGHWMRPEPVR